MIEDLLKSRLNGFPGLAALVGTRIYPVIVNAESPMPAVTYRRAATAREVLDNADPGLARVQFEVRAWSQDYEEARAVAQQVRLALERWQDDANGVQDTYPVDESEDFVPEVLTYYREVVMEVVHDEEVG